ncbi:uncharacterized protein LOC115229755 [Octopus sinensis]|uniref:Uncharacterized protein LOC115229755 n=1 Tax=Octopus sinensis TaxID=2607531 RepID=A0A6P7U103_9MOLL|nr:uncharacterized protein LOC115229755 [Octopus sinensis]
MPKFLNTPATYFSLPISLHSGKKEGGIRPIAVGCFYRRLASKVACRQATKLLGSELRPIQLGVGVSGGCEAAVHATRQFISASQNQPNNPHLLIKLDLINAFNSVRRDVIFESIIRRSPFIARLVALAYGRPSLLIAGDHSISSCNGVQQGDPLGPLLFALAIDPVARSVSSVFNAWYLDDATIGGTLESVLDDLRTLIPALHAIGLDINPRKSEIFNISYDTHRFSVPHCSIESLLPNIHGTSPGNLKILGSPIFHSGVVSTLSEKTSNLASMSCNLGIIDSHSALFLLRNCFAIPKLLFTLRSAPCFANPESLSRFDHALRTCLESICNAPFDDLGWEQAILPISHGGIGARSATDLSLPAFLSSTHATSTLVQEILQPFSESESVAAKSRWLGLSLELPQNPHAQVEWDRILCDQKLNNLKPKLNQHRLACLLAASQPYSGAWLTAIPMGSIGTLLDDDCLRIGISLRLGLNVCREHRCRCGSTVDPFGLHPLSCQRSSGRFPRHTALNDIVKRTLETAGLPSQLEPVGLAREDGKRPDGLTTFPFENGKSLIWDATCTDTFSAGNILTSASEPGSAANLAETLKIKKYSALSHRHIFAPIAVETSGVLGPRTKKFLIKLGDLFAFYQMPFEVRACKFDFCGCDLKFVLENLIFAVDI